MSTKLERIEQLLLSERLAYTVADVAKVLAIKRRFVYCALEKLVESNKVEKRRETGADRARGFYMHKRWTEQ